MKRQNDQLRQSADNTRQGLGSQVPPRFIHVEIYFTQKGCTAEDAAIFYNHFRGLRWQNPNGTPVANWKTLACDWIWTMKYDKR